MERQTANHRTERPVGANTTTKDDLLRRARAAIEAGEQSLHEAAEALGIAKENHAASQREMAEAVGKSAAWVNKLLKWRRSGYKDHSPFGPTTKKGRVEHAQQRVRASGHRKSQAPDPEEQSNSGPPKDDPLFDLEAFVWGLDRLTVKRKVEDFAAADIPPRALARNGQFLIDLANLKESARKPAKGFVEQGNGLVPTEESAEAMRAAHAANDAAAAADETESSCA